MASIVTFGKYTGGYASCAIRFTGLSTPLTWNSDEGEQVGRHLWISGIVPGREEVK
jgi:hypothetical protein